MYALLFEIDGNQEDCKNFVNATRYHETVRDQYGDGFIYPNFMRVGFKNVYRQSPPDNYQKEWLLVPKRQQQYWKGQSRKKKQPVGPFHFESNPSWLLFDRQVEPTAISEAKNALNSGIDTLVPSNELIIPIPSLQNESINFFKRKGEFWEIGYKGKTTTVKNLNGIRYIALLLERPGVSVPCRELCRIVSGRTPEKTMSEAAAIAEGLNIGGGVQIINDEDAKKHLWRKYQDLHNELADTKDTPEGRIVINEIEKEMAAILSALKETRFVDPGTKKIQDNTRQRLKSAFEAIDKAGLKKLAQHLEISVRTGGAYDFIYAGSIPWNISQ